MNPEITGYHITIAPEKSNDPFISSIKSTIVRTLKEALGPDAVIKEIKVEPKVIVGKATGKTTGYLTRSDKYYCCLIRKRRSWKNNNCC